MTSPLRISTVVDVAGQDRTRTLLEEQIATITKSLNALQQEDPAGYYNKGRVKLRKQLATLQGRLGGLPAPVPTEGQAPDAAMDLIPRLAAPVFSTARIGSERVGVAQLKNLPF